MKQFVKRLLSLLIVAVMVCAMLPVTALAADTHDSVPLKLTISSYSAPFINGSTGEHTVKSINFTTYISRSAVGSDNASGSARAYFTKDGDTYRLTLDVKVGKYEETFTGNAVSNAKITNKDMSEAEGTITFGLSFNTSGGTSTYISIYGGKDLAPSKPSDSVVSNLLNKINVNCTNADVEHDTASYDLISGTYTVGDVTKVGSSYTSTVTVTSTQYVSAYNTSTGATHAPATETKTATLTYSGSVWTLSGNGITVDVACETPEDPDPAPDPTPQAPTAPSSDDVKNLMGNDAVKVYCGTVTTHGEKTYGLADGTFTVGQVTGDATNGYKVDVTVQAASYVAAYGDNHELDDSASKTITLTWNGTSWVKGNTVAFKVKCTPVEEKTWTIKLRILEVSDDYNLGYNLVSGETTRTIPNNTNVNQLNVTVPSFNTVAGELNYQLKDNYGFIGITWDQTADDDSMINIPETDTTKQISNVYVTSNGYTIWYVVKEAEPVDDTPEVPSDAELAELLKESIIVDCVNSEVQHPDKKYGLMGSWTKQVSEDGKTITVTVPTQPYCDAYNTDVAAGHTLVNAATTATLTVTWDEENEKWTATPITIQVKCETPAPAAPTAPSDAELAELLKESIIVDCVNSEVQHADKKYGLMGSWTKQISEDGKTITVTVPTQSYCDAYNTDVAAGHTLVNAATTATLTVTWNEENEKWTATSITIQVKCETPAPAAPTDAEVKAMIKVLVDCINKNKAHDTWQYDLVDGTYTIGAVTKNEGIYTSTITIKADKYIEKYNKDEAKDHALAPSNPDSYSLTLTYTAEGWKIMHEAQEVKTPVYATFEVICKNATTSNTSGDLDNVPKTGDLSMMIIGGCAAAIAMLAAVAVVLSKKRSFN